jgi:hypothetical protein
MSIYRVINPHRPGRPCRCGVASGIAFSKARKLADELQEQAAELREQARRLLAAADRLVAYAFTEQTE